MSIDLMLIFWSMWPSHRQIKIVSGAHDLCYDVGLMVGMVLHLCIGFVLVHVMKDSNMMLFMMLFKPVTLTCQLLLYLMYTRKASTIVWVSG